MVQEWKPIKFDADGQPAAFGWVDTGEDPNAQITFPDGSVGTRLPVYGVDENGNPTYDPSGYKKADGSPGGTPATHQVFRATIAKDDTGGGFGDFLKNLAASPIGMAAGAAFLPGLVGSNGALAGGDLGVFDYPSLTAGEAATYGAPSLSGYTGAANAAGAAGGSLAADLAGATGGATNPAYTYDPGGATNPFGPLEGGGNLSEYNYVPGGETTPFGPMPGGGNLGEYNYVPGGETKPFGPTPTGGNIGAGAGAATQSATGLASLLRSAGVLGTDTSNDGLIDAAGRLAPGLLGAFAANAQGNKSAELANTLMGYGAPSRARFEASMMPGFDVTSIPGYQGAVDNSMNTMLRKLSTQGNPFGNPGNLIEANKSVVAGTALPALQEYQRLNLSGGGLGNLNAAAPAAMASANSAGTNVWNSIGYGVDQAINGNKQKSLADILKGYTLP